MRIVDEIEGDSPRENSRRTFLNSLSATAMAGGLVGGYGMFASIAGQFLYSAPAADLAWLFVTELSRVKAGEAIAYRAPQGQSIAIARRGDSGTADDFVALSSVCPHLGCQVHWEGVNNRFFCPCHNGAFDPNGKTTEGPPKAAGQSLARFLLQVEDGLLFIQVPVPRGRPSAALANSLSPLGRGLG